MYVCVCVGMYAHAYVCAYVHTYESVNNPEHKLENHLPCSPCIYK